MSIVKDRPFAYELLLPRTTEDAWLKYSYDRQESYLYDSMSAALEISREEAKQCLHWRAYELGVVGCRDKESITDCPIFPVAGLIESWRAGWMDALADKVHG